MPSEKQDVNPPPLPQSPSMAQMQAVAAAFERGDDDATVGLAQALIRSHPNHGFAWMALGAALGRQGRHAQSLQALDEALRVDPRDHQACCNRANALLELGRDEEALDAYAQALRQRPDHVEALRGQSLALRRLGRAEEALGALDTLSRLVPAGDIEVLQARAATLHALGRLQPALAAYDEILRLQPGDASALDNRGNVLFDLRRLPDALASLDQAIRLRPGNAAALNNRGTVLQEMGQLEDAVASYDAALRAAPGDAAALRNRALALARLKRMDESVHSFRRALLADPDADFLLGEYLHAKMHACDWQGLGEDLERVKRGLASGKRVIAPFQLLALVDDPVLHRQAASVHALAKCGRLADHSLPVPPFRGRVPHERIRVGYFSADFHGHATSALVVEMLESHDRERFETYGFSFGPRIDDAMRQRVSRAFSRFIDVSGRDDAELARLSRELGIDIAVDLKGYTQDSRPGLFAHRCAPVQVSFLGYPGTLASPFIDYVIADKMVIPPQERPNYSENVVYLPGSHQPNDSKRVISERLFARAELGLPEQGFVFCCFNNNFKILPATFGAWMRILQAVPGSVLWLLEDNAAASRHLRQHARGAGVDPARLVFGRRMLPHDHLARHRQADLFIDTLPYNAGTTASDALWTGLPVLTCAGRSFASRLAASLLHSLGLSELVTHTRAEYEAQAIAIARDPARLAALRQRLAQARTRSTLFDGRDHARRIETAYGAMHARRLAGLPPVALEVEPGVQRSAHGPASPPPR